MIIYKTACLFSLFVVSTVTAFAQGPTLVKICDLFSDIEKWDGTFIRTTGDIETRQEGGPWLSGRGCPTKIEVKGISFPNIIQLANPKAPVGLLHHVDFVWEENNLGEFWGAQLQVNRKTEHIHGTIIGLFETRSPISDLVKFTSVHPEGQLLGFGPGGPAPAQIIVKSIIEVHIEKNQRPAEQGSQPK